MLGNLFGQVVKLFFGREIGINDAIAPLRTVRPCDHFGQPMISLRTKHHINNGFAAHKLRPFGLRDTARHRDNHLVAAIGFLGFFVFAHTPQIGKDLFSRLFTDMAGVEDHHIGVLCTVDRLVSQWRQDILHALTVIDIHLTAIGFYKKFLRFSHARSVSLSQTPKSGVTKSHRKGFGLVTKTAMIDQMYLETRRKIARCVKSVNFLRHSRPCQSDPLTNIRYHGDMLSQTHQTNSPCFLEVFLNIPAISTAIAALAKHSGTKLSIRTKQTKIFANNRQR